MKQVLQVLVLVGGGLLGMLSALAPRCAAPAEPVRAVLGYYAPARMSYHDIIQPELSPGALDDYAVVLLPRANHGFDVNPTGTSSQKIQAYVAAFLNRFLLGDR